MSTNLEQLGHEGLTGGSSNNPSVASDTQAAEVDESPSFLAGVEKSKLPLVLLFKWYVEEAKLPLKHEQKHQGLYRLKTQ